MVDSKARPEADPKPGFRWPIAVAHSIAAPADRVWAAISAPGNLEPCHPFCARNPVQSWPGIGSSDQIQYLSGLVLERKFRRWFDGIGYDLDIGPPGATQVAFVSWRILPRADMQCVLRISIYPEHLQRVPVALRWVPHLIRLRPFLTTYLQSVVRGFEWYVSRGEAVPRNQFGALPYFSGSR